MRKRIILFLVMFSIILAGIFVPSGAYASGPTDEILNYTIQVDVNDDGSLNMDYHIDWKVLQSGGDLGPVSWVEIGVPNSHYSQIESHSDTIKSLKGNDSYGEHLIRVDFDRSYYEGEVISFDFSLVQDSMYRVNRSMDGYTDYDFTPGWFDGIDVDELIIRWNAENVYEWNPSGLIEDGYITWETSLKGGEKYGVCVTYPNDAYGFDMSRTVVNEEYYDDYDDSSESGWSVFFMILAGLFSTIFSLLPFVLFYVFFIKLIFNKSRGFTTKTEIKREKITYFESCPHCGAPRKEQEEKCEFCGAGMIKSKEIITENQAKQDKNISSLNKDGVYRYGTNPNVFVSVHTSTIKVPTPRSSSSSSYSGGSSRGGSSHSCAHSSCAHSSCACACACACAGGGRAGCTVKDFYNTNLKLRQLALRSSYDKK